jgi:hypothetical protein
LPNGPHYPIQGSYPTTAEQPTITEFLVALGFSIDESQQREFVDALKQSHEGIAKGMTGIVGRFAKLATAATGAAISLGAAMVNIGQQMGAGPSCSAPTFCRSASNFRNHLKAQ